MSYAVWEEEDYELWNVDPDINISMFKKAIIQGFVYAG